MAHTPARAFADKVHACKSAKNPASKFTRAHGSTGVFQSDEPTVTISSLGIERESSSRR
ncbi:hypothetical protein ES332_A01G180200v1 [Gossypium tomentosum]|uniref:Uncharacterized protein n=1 Tax=Gossypium tomentosum TaxID=34277 RepID=A0A5D2RS18_GOSTO|nr:hypothetical protein ES332_A01G180200v1 [Gossypium tomentosum]